ncbi:MAG: DsbC family protein [Proteobacteria bacterium]|jgi:thiol:disulfide interchange protein DsbC|nr:DsbC family protein [Pseudomonadota bacterium]
MQLSRLWLATLFSLFIIFPAAADDAGLQQARESIKKIVPDAKADAVQASPVNGLYQVTIPPEMFYISADGKYAFTGDILDLKNGTNLSRPVRDQVRVTAIDNIGEKNMIVYGPKTAAHTISVFTDIDCGYCRKLHSEMAKYNKAGIRVRYLAYPRSGIGSKSYDKAVAVWCAKDKNAALTKAKQGQDIPMNKCDNPVAMEYELGQRIGVQGTPAIVTENGKIIPGYVPAERLALILDAHTAKK